MATALEKERLASFLEEHGDEVLDALIAGLRASAARDPAALASVAEATPAVTASVWRHVGEIDGFEHQWPEVHEHYGTMQVWEGADADGPVRLAIGAPRERLEIYGRERGWVSVWEVVNGQPREQRANFIEADDFDATGERIARIRGRGGNKKAGFAPHERHLLPAGYAGVRVEVQRDRCHGPYAPNRLGVVASDQEIETMLNHALAHLRLGSGGSTTGPKK